MKFLHICFFLFAACAQIPSQSDNLDELDKILLVMKSKTTADLVKFFGAPDEVSIPDQNKNMQILRYKLPKIDAYIDADNKNKISHLTIFFFKDFDNYTYLKKRFKNYKWLEEKLPNDNTSDVATDKYLAKVPEIGMQFEYDNQAPKRKVMWIYFD